MRSPEAPEKRHPLERRVERERRARKRAEELLETRSRELYLSQVALEDAYSATVEVFASLVGGKSGRTPTELRQLGRDARNLAKQLGLEDARAQTVYLAALLCDLGKLALPDDLVSRPLVTLSVKELGEFGLHPQLAYEALVALPPLEAVAQTILGHCETNDGKGYPNRLTWDDISLESQVLCIVKDFDALKRGILVSAALTESEAIEYLRSRRDSAYGAEVVDVFVAMIEDQEEHTSELTEMRLAARSLQRGMTLTRDLMNEQGVLILPAGQQLDDVLVKKLRAMSRTRSGDLIVYVEAASELSEDSDTGDDDEPTNKESALPD